MKNALSKLLKKSVGNGGRAEVTQLLSIKTILQAEHMYDILNQDLDTENYTSFRSVENRLDATETVMKRNYYGFKACRAIQILNSECKRVTGAPFLKGFYQVKGIKIDQRNTEIFDSMLAEFDQVLDEAVEELEQAAM